MSGNHFPHDGEHGRSCTGYGCDCDEKNYGHHSGGRKSSGGGGGAWIAIAIVVIGSIGAILMIVLAFIVIMSR